MFKRPSQRVKAPPAKFERPKEGTYLYDIITNKPIQFYEYKKQPVMYQSLYLKALEKNNMEIGIPYKDPKLPVYEPPTPQPKPEEPNVPYLDRVYLNLRILKSGIVRVKIVPNFAVLYQKYYKHAMRPPMKQTIQAYKAMGFSAEFLEKIKKSEEKKLAFAKKVPKILEKIFDKEPVKKAKKEKPKEKLEEIPLEEPDADDDENPDQNEEDCTMDVEPEVEDEEVVEDDYISDED